MGRKPILVRTSLYASASRPGHLARAAFFETDCIVYDLEDSVSMVEKDAARFLIYNTVRYHRPKDKHVQIRINGSDTIYFEEDLQAAVRARPDALRVPKIESAREVRELSEAISAIEAKAGLEVGGIRLWCVLESYSGVLNAREIAGSDSRVEALILGAEDFTTSMGAKRIKDGLELFYARNMMLMACREANIYAIDALFSDIDDLEGLRKDTLLGKNLGFDGKTVIHPCQIDIANSAYSPDEGEVAYAQRVIEALREGRRQGKGVVSLEGKMLDKPVELRAMATLRMARAAGIKIEGGLIDND